MPLALADVALFLLPWPLSSFSRMALARPPAADAPPPALRYAEEPVMATFYEHALLVVSAAWKVLFAAWAYYCCGAVDKAAAAALAPRWVATVLARDVAVTWAVGSLWDFLHLHPRSPLYAQLQPHKFKPQAPPPGQVPHDALFATCTAAIAAAFEVGLLHLWGRGSLRLAELPGDAWYADPATLALLLLLPYLQIVHFFVTHRAMHRWWSARGQWPDPGQWLYTHVHSLHHRSRDPTAFSGISMHPVEGALFMTTMVGAALCGAHPIVILHCKFYNIVVAMLGHESHGDPSTGGHSHWLHHQLVNCNYGGNFVPLDWLLGSYARDENHFEKLQDEAAAAAKAKKAL